MNTLKLSMFVVILTACSTEKGDGFGGTGENHTSDTDETGTSTNLPRAETIWEVEDRGFDLVSSGGLLYASTQAGGAIWSYDPDTDEAERIAWDLGDLQAIAMADSEIHAAFTDSHVEGWVAAIEPPKGVEVMASATDSGVLFRRPAGLAYGDNGEIYALDTKAEAIWQIGANGSVSTYYEIGGVAIFHHDGNLYVGGDEGIFEVGSNGTTLIDSRPAFGLEVFGGSLIASNTSDFIYIVGGEQIATGNLGRPGAMATVNGVLYIMDTISGNVSAVQLN